MDSTVLSTALVLFFILDPFGNIPIILSILKNIESSRHLKILIREGLIALLILVLFLFFGGKFLQILHLDTYSVTLSGGVILFIIGIRMIFPKSKSESLFGDESEPMIVPIAMPLFAGPSALAILIVMTKSESVTQLQLLYALLLAWGTAFCLILMSPLVLKVLRHKGLMAMERLMGMILLMMSVQMFFNGIRSFMGSV